jgi:hypothetical protein
LKCYNAIKITKKNNYKKCCELSTKKKKVKPSPSIENIKQNRQKIKKKIENKCRNENRVKRKVKMRYEWEWMKDQ